MSKIIAVSLFTSVLALGITSQSVASQVAKDFFAHEKRKEKADQKRMKFAAKKTEQREKANRKKVGAAERFIAARKKIIKKREKKESLYQKREAKRQKREAEKLSKALKQAEKRRRKNSASPIPPDREYGIIVRPPKNPPGTKKKSEIKPDFIF